MRGTGGGGRHGAGTGGVLRERRARPSRGQQTEQLRCGFMMDADISATTSAAACGRPMRAAAALMAAQARGLGQQARQLEHERGAIHGLDGGAGLE